MMQTFTELAGVPVHYDRDHEEDYGTRGRPYEFEAQPSLIAKLEAAFEKLWGLLGRAEVILSAGAYVDKAGWHGRGLAFDLDGIIWPEGKCIAKLYPNYPQLYLMVECCLRRHLGTVLNYHYNEAHRDHWHIQDDERIAFVPSHSQTLFLQAALSETYGERIALDGMYGPQTRAALERALDYVDMDGANLYGERGLARWREFLAHTAAWPLRGLGPGGLFLRSSRFKVPVAGGDK